MRTRSIVAVALLLVASPVFAAGSEEGFTALFDGKTLDGWQGGKDGYEVVEGAIVCKEKGGGNLYTAKEYGDFHLKFEFKLTPGANNGIGIRTPLQGDPAYVGMEIQVLDDSSDHYKGIKEWQHHGSVYGVVPAKTGHLKPAGEWNSEEIIAKGKQIKVVLNGETIVDADIEKASTPKTVDGKDHPGLKRDKGYIGFCGHGAHVEYRNLRIKELK
jgi:3-keto-disaccharide hydrolase